MPHRPSVLASILATWILVMSTVAAAQTPVTSPIASGDQWQISGVEQTSTANRGQVLSPDGQWLAGTRGAHEFCVWAVSTLETTCLAVVPRGDALPRASDAFVWAPDSTAVAFPSSQPDLGDSDILLFELATGRVTNLTDDGYYGYVDVLGLRADSVTDPTNDYGIPVDDTPVWSPDSQQIAFSRLVRDPQGVWESITRIDRSGGEPVEIVPLGSIWPMGISTPMAWLPDDTLLYTKMSLLTPDDPRGGLWRAIPLGDDPNAVGRALKLVPGGSEAVIPYPVVHDIHPNRGVVSLVSYGRLLSPGRFPAGEGFGILDLVDGSLSPLPELHIGGRSASPASPAIFSPDGPMALIVYAVGKVRHLVLLDLTTGAHQVLEHPSLGQPDRVAPEWAVNDRLLLSSQRDGDWITLVIQLERTTDATPVIASDQAIAAPLARRTSAP